jgi:MFS family permease
VPRRFTQYGHMKKAAPVESENLGIAPPKLDTAPSVSDGFRRYALWILLLVYTVNFLDRQVVTILAEPIKTELGVSDLQLGVLTGLAFGLLYVTMGLPIARLADRFNRVWIITASLVVWSGFTVLCGRAVNYWTLVAARVGVGIGEAGCVPTSHSLIADYTPRPKRASALAFYSMGVPLGSLLGLAMGGVIADTLGWRAAFLIAGAPGLVLAVVCFLTLREPRQNRAKHHVAVGAEVRTGLLTTLRHLARKRTFWCFAFAGSIKSFLGYGQGAFYASFFLRAHSEEIAELAGRFGLQSVGFVGIALGLLIGVFGAISSYVGGTLADRLGGKDLRAYGSISAVAALLCVPCLIAALLVDSAVLGLLLFVPFMLVAYIWYGPVYASAQGLVPSTMRATSASIVLFIINIFGMFFGAIVVGGLSDFFNEGLGLGPAEGIRWALIHSTLLGLVAATLFWLGRKRIREEMES